MVNTREAVAPWCGIDLSSGNLTVVLEQYNCFDAEVYADELELEEPVEFREDQRSRTIDFSSQQQHANRGQSRSGDGSSAISLPT